MGIAKLYGQKASGIDINGIIKDYYVYAGSNVSAGDLVEYINGVAGQTTETSVDTQLSTQDHDLSIIFAQLLPNGNVFITYSIGNDLHLNGVVVTINGSSIIVGTETNLATNKHSGASISTQLLPNGNVFIAHSHGSNYYLYGMIVSINGTTITVDTNTSISGTANAGASISTQLLPNGNIFIAHSYDSNRYLAVITIRIDGTNITANTSNKLVDGGVKYSGVVISTQLLSNGNIFIAHSNNTDYYLYGVVVTIDGTTITQGTCTQLSTIIFTGYTISTQLLSNGNIFIAHIRDKNYYYLNGMVVTINGTTITAGTDTQLSSTKNTGFQISTQLLPNGNVFIAHSYNTDYYLYGMVATINGTSITHDTDTQLSLNNYNHNSISTHSISTQLLLNGNIFIAHGYPSTRNFYYVYAQIWGVDENNIPTNQIKVPTYEQQVRPTTSSKFDGVAKTSGVGGTSTAHNQQVSIYTKPKKIIKTGDIIPKTWTEVVAGTEYVANDGTKLTVSGVSGATVAFNACDGNTSTSWHSQADTNPKWIKFEFVELKKLLKLKTRFTTAGGSAYFSYGYIEGSNDNSNWNQLYTFASSQNDNTELQEIILTSPNYYKYYRLNGSATSTGGYSIGVYEIQTTEYEVLK